MPQNITQLIVTNKKPHKAASTDTIRRWIKNLFAETKAIPNIFTAHSKDIIKRAGLSTRRIKRFSFVFPLFRGFCYFHFFHVCRRGCRGTGQR